MTPRERLAQRLPLLSDEDIAALLAVAERLVASHGTTNVLAAPAVADRKNTAPMAGSVRILGDIVPPIGEAWDAELRARPAR